MTVKITLAAVLTTAALALTGCSSAESNDSPTTDPDQSESTTASAEPSAEPTVSPALVEREKPGTSAQVIVGNGRYDVGTTYDIDGATGFELGEKANVFLREHYLRRDRWMGKWFVKKGELDAYGEKVTPALFSEVNDSLTFFHDAQDQHGFSSDKWPRKTRKASEQYIDGISSMFFNAGVGKGSGDIEYRSVDRDIFRGSAENNWEKHLIGAPITWNTFEASHKVGSDCSVRVNFWQAWKKVKGEWVIFAVGRNTA